MLEPLIDDAIIANINNVISIFQRGRRSQLTEMEVQKSLVQLKKVKDMLQKINDEVSLTSSSSSANSINYNNSKRNSVESIRKSVEIPPPRKLSRKLSYSSLKNSLNVLPYNISPKPSNSRKIMKKSSLTKLSKNRLKSKNSNPPPKIIETFYSTCRIHRYDDSSHSFEIMRAKKDGEGDSKGTPEIVIVSLASGETAFFKSVDGNNSFLNNFLPSNENVFSK